MSKYKVLSKHERGMIKNVPSFIPLLKINGIDIDRVSIPKSLRIFASSYLKWGPNVHKIHAKSFKRSNVLTYMKRAVVVKMK